MKKLEPGTPVIIMNISPRDATYQFRNKIIDKYAKLRSSLEIWGKSGWWAGVLETSEGQRITFHKIKIKALDFTPLFASPLNLDRDLYKYKE